ncbi:FAD/NAD(P)-binding protein [Demequina sp. SYSU T00039]|uniref:FAD/NAD(P)-binding protein n=1 Tax=Demequina lignilytica TaxID=3051663 RepID=A0AAW7M1S8_9MICO|nr:MULTISPECIES: FAD/NAD(P)-binding protein [unclassified Demequina]MDN4477291.1 FAD/NAD(P)-binding protein [Demequina sp. SYSU T00039-1]MDN4487464.1 FAD/NAD(P)-binding protein [Demequina sp. SYSU T00039]
MTASVASSPAHTTDPMVPRRYVITHVRQDTRDTFTLLLDPVDGPPLEFRAGQFTMLHAFGVGEVPISISGDPRSPAPLEHTIRNVGAVTRALVEAAPGTEVGVRGPFGTSWDVDDAEGRDVVFVTGGIGLAPLRPAILDVLSHRERYGKVLLLYGSRTPDDILYGHEMHRWADLNDVNLQMTVDNAPYGYKGKVGFVTELVTRAGFDPRNAFAFVCGPEVMMRSAATSLVSRGIPKDRIRLSMERSMKCGVGLCGHCQLRELFICVDGPVLGYDRLEPLMAVRQL